VRLSYGLFLLFMAMISMSLQATHIVGGEITYKHLNNDNYEVRLRLYIDCFNGSPDAIAQDLRANFSVFEGDSGKLLDLLSQSVLRSSPVRVSRTNYNCIKIAPDACVDAYDYVTSMVLPPRKGGYYISFQRCCRNNTIVNIVNPLSTGENIWTHIGDTTGIGYDNSPEFKLLPPNFLCTNAPLVFDHSATDDDGDSLVYEFFLPYTGGTTFQPRPNFAQYETPPFSTIQFLSPYTPSNAIPSSPIVSLNRKTGLLKMTPTMVGQFVIGIVVKEYRNGKLIGETKRDFQFNVQNCVFETTSAFVNPSVNCNREVFFTNNSQNADRYYWEFGDTTTLADTLNTKDAYYRYPTAGTYKVKLIASKGNCTDSIIKIVTVFDRINFKLPNDTVLCVNQNIVLAPDSFYSTAAYNWSTGSKDSILQVNVQGAYWLNVKIGNCSSFDTVQVFNDNSTVILFGDSLTCLYGKNELSANVYLKGDFKTHEWYLDEKKLKQHDKDSFIQIKQAGRYRVSGLNINNCPFTDSIWIEAPDLNRDLILPNVFTPDGDSFNPVFPELLPKYKYHVWIYNRWGIKVFEGENEPWDGDIFPDGTYYYLIEMNLCDYVKKTSGVVYMFR
jgi:hypothetical protein